ncbi:reverse transcriptase [Phytophthora megakarya]|uniref:Reverse transcriptase n=1 Tax=Phytophthora megakarya TaxID=4795 RepID=A0A225WJM5_9STRA|nr:reverse transcriptase [Phytophthora megakarya]
MPLGLKNVFQIYQRVIDNALYGFARIPKSEGDKTTLDVVESGEPVDLGKPSLLGRRSYIDNILIPVNSWDQLCDRREDLLEVCGKWNLSISVVKSFWGMPKVSHNGVEVNPKDLSALTDLALPGSLTAMHRFIEDYAIYTSVLYELRAIDFAAMMKDITQVQIQRVSTLDPCPYVLQSKITTTPILRHFDPDRRATVVVYATDWAISRSLTQDIYKIYHPVMFPSRTLKENELNNGITEKEMLALLRILDLNNNALWAAVLSPWTLEITKCIKGEDEILGTLAASITSRSEVDKALVSIASKKEPRRKIQAPIPVIGRDEDLYAVSFDGSARDKSGGGVYSAVLWKLAEWSLLSGYAEGLRVNEAEYHGLPLCLDLLEGLDPRLLVISGDSNLVIRQVRGEIDCKTPGLTLLRQRALDRLRTWPDHELVHVKRD